MIDTIIQKVNSDAYKLTGHRLNIPELDVSEFINVDLLLKAFAVTEEPSCRLRREAFF